VKSSITLNKKHSQASQAIQIANNTLNPSSLPQWI